MSLLVNYEGKLYISQMCRPEEASCTTCPGWDDEGLCDALCEYCDNEEDTTCGSLMNYQQLAVKRNIK